MKKIYLNPQSKGSLGKSFETECRIAWLDALGISWTGFDLDDRHGSFVKRHPEKVRLVNLDHGAKDSLLSVFSEAFNRPESVIVIDTRAQADRLILDAVVQLGVFERAEQAGARFVFTLFPSDDNESLQNLADIIKVSARKVDYIIARNPAKTQGLIYDQAPLKATLEEKLGSREIRIPVITNTTLHVLERQEREKKQGIPFTKFAEGVDGIDSLITGEMAYLLGTMASQYNDLVYLLVPESEISKVPKSKRKAEQVMEEFDLSL